MATARIIESKSRGAGAANQSAALELARSMPRLTAEARRIASTAAAGIHGRRRAGQGDSFWQFRTFHSGESSSRVDWRRSARDGRLYVREREWEAAENVWLWLDRSPSMAFQSSLARVSKLERTIVLGLAVADMLVRGGERTGLFRLTPPQASYRIIERLAEALILDAERLDGETIETGDLPALSPINLREEIILIGDFIADPATLESHVAALSARGGRGHLLLIADPIEEVFPFSGESEFLDPQGGGVFRVGDAAGFAKSYRDRIAAHRENLRQMTSKIGWTFTIHRTDRPAIEALYALMAVLHGDVMRPSASVAAG
ncbi:MAG: DUF58 domain-containing protein [Beijerinckiaceae bacterium]|nr:DUF58 domain-containing protein [Beijerinckiaceae bacterium]